MSRINAENPQESQGAHVPNHHSNFLMGNNQFITCRFGEYVPFFFFNSYEKDKVRQRNVTTTRSLSLKAPLMEDINLKRDYFQVYYDALLPINWDKCYIRPKRGDIVDWQKCSTNVADFRDKIRRLTSVVHENYIAVDSGTTPSSILYGWLKALTFLEMFYSDGALINHFGCHLSRCLTIRAKWDIDNNPDFTRDVNFDAFFDRFCQMLMGYIRTEYDANPGADSFSLSYSVVGQTSPATKRVNSASDLRALISLFREGQEVLLNTSSDASSALSVLRTFVRAQYMWQANYTGEDSFSFDLAPLWSYQIACAHFYSDDNVDYVFSAELFRSYIGSLIVFDVPISSFEYNGISYLYDYLSAFYFDSFVSYFTSESSFSADAFSYFRVLFGFNRSLRYQDYFAGARTAPIAVGDETEVSVDDNKVSVVDITRSIQWQRLLNNIQRLPQELGRFISSSTGKNQSFDYHNPGWLAHTKDTVFAAEVENTGSAQVTEPNSVTATLRGKSSDKEFTFESDRPCIIIGIQYFDIRRAYFTGVKRVLQNESREDMFMPELQYIGDQPIYNSELDASKRQSPFGYTEQYNWLKQNYDEAMGGFVNDALPGWAFLFDPDFYYPKGLSSPYHISPDFIRSLAPELDQFFLSLTGYSLGTYFHFQQKVVNITSASRNMVRHSQILQ